MRGLLILAGAVLVAGSYALAQDKAKGTDKSPASAESKIVAATRKKLEAPISVDFKDTPLKDALQELEGLTEVKFYRDATSVPGHKSITYSAKDKPAKDVLDGIFKMHGLGYIIHRKDKEGDRDRYEGWVQVVQGDQRGDDVPKKDAAKADAKLDPKKPAKDSAGKTEPPKPAPDDKERLAASKLKLAKQFLEDKQVAEAREYCEDIIKKYPDTKAAAEAKTLLEKMKK